MATRLKTIEYAVPQLLTLADATLTAMTTITAYIPEFSGAVTIRKAIVQVNFMEIAAAVTQNYTSRRVDVSVGGAGATSYTNANLYTGTGENTCIFHAADATAHFTTNWASGTSKTIALSVAIDGFTSTTGAAVWGNVSATVSITYEYDDTQTTQIKTVYIPLNAPVGALATTKPGTATDTIAALDTELPETSKTYRNMHIVCQGNVNSTASATDSNLQMQIDTLTQYTSTNLEMGAASDYWARFVWATHYYDSGGSAAGLGMTTNATHSFYLWASVARHNHSQAYMVITYEFDASASSGVFVSTLLPMQATLMGGTASTDFERLSRVLWIEEPGTITTKDIAFYAFWEQAAAISTLNLRVGTGSFIAYTDAAAQFCGGNGCMVRNDSAFTLARGTNSLNADVYRSDVNDFGHSFSGFLIVNYTAGKPTQGYGAANHTVKWNGGFTFDGATATNRMTAAFAVTIPEANYFINSYGCNVQHASNSGLAFAGAAIMMEKTNAAGQWLAVDVLTGHTDVETGLHQHFAGIRDEMMRYPSDPWPGRLDPEGTRRWWWSYATAGSGFVYLDLWITYHTITYTVSGTVSGSAGGTVNIGLWRTTNRELALTTSRSGNGAYSLTWYDNTETLFAEGREDATHLGRSDNGTAA
jgi:hypothetical protein